MLPFRSALLAGVAGGGAPDPIMVTEDAHYLNVALQIDATGQDDGTGYANDQSRHAHALTYLGSAAIASEKFVFNGSTDAIEIANNVLWRPGSRLTIECFGVEFSAVDDTHTLVSWYDTISNHRSWIFAVTSAGVLYFAYSSSGDSVVDVATYALNPATDGTEYDLGFGWDGSSVSLYVNGEQVASGSWDGAYHEHNRPLRIGAICAGSSTDHEFQGSMAGVRITRGFDRTGQGVTYQRHARPLTTTQSATTDPDWDKVVLLLEALADGTIRDASPYDWPASVGGNAAVSTGVQPVSGVNSIALDGSGDYVQLVDHPALEFAGSDFTLELWARHAVNTALHTYFSKYAGGGNQRSLWYRYDGSAATDNLILILDNNGSSPVALNQTNPWTPTVDTFYHVAHCRNGDTHRDFVDGAQVGTDQTSSVSAFDGSAPLVVGAGDSAGLTQYMNGYVAEVRVTIGAGRYTSGFTAPTAAFPRG